MPHDRKCPFCVPDLVMKYMPGDHGFQEEWVLNEKPVAKETIVDRELLDLKFRLLDLFDNKFVITSDGAIREKVE